MGETDFEKQLSEITLPEVLMDEHKMITKKKMTQLRNTPFIGLVIVTLIGIGSGKFSYFIDLPSLQFVTLIPLLLLAVSYGVGGVKMVFTAPFQMNATGEKKEAFITVLKDLRIYTVTSGWFGVTLGAVLMFNNHSLWEKELAELLPTFGILIMTLVYGYFLAPNHRIWVPINVFTYCHRIWRHFHHYFHV